MCGSPLTGTQFTSVVLPTFNIKYNHVCGRAVGGYARYLLPTNPLTNLMFRDCLLPTQSIMNSNTSGPWLECGQTLVIVVFITAYVLVAHPTVLHLMLVMGTTANLAVILIQVISGSDQ